VAEKSIAEVFLALVQSEARYLPSFGVAGFSGDYGSLTLKQKLYGFLRIMESYTSQDRAMTESFRNETRTNLTGKAINGTETEKRVFRSVEAKFTEALKRIEAEEVAIEALRALVQNTYGEEAEGQEAEKEGPGQEGDHVGGSGEVDPGSPEGAEEPE
jgi:hypothetical protein